MKGTTSAISKSSLFSMRGGHFSILNQNGKRYFTPFFTLVLGCRTTLDKMNVPHGTYLGMKVTKRIGKAVIRNKVKRRIRHMVHDICIGKDIACMVIPKSTFVAASFQELEQALKQIIQKANIPQSS